MNNIKNINNLSQPPYFESIRIEASRRWDQLERDPILAAPWYQLFRQIQSPRHVISELLQNADDAGATQATVEFHGDEFVFTHNGVDFNEDQFASLCRFGYSNKRSLHTIGFRGVGFKSTFSIGDEVHLITPTLSVVFEKQRFTEPIWSARHTQLARCTQIRIDIRSDKVKHALNHNIREWYESPTSLLFFRNIRTLKVHGRALRWKSKGAGPVEHSDWMSSPMMPDDMFLVVRSPREEIPKEAQKEIFEERMATDGTTFPTCQVEIVLGMEGRLFVVLPTEVKTQLPFACNAPFIQDTERSRIKEPSISPTNTWLLQRAGQLAAETMLAWLEQGHFSLEKRSRAYGLFPKVDRNDASIQGECGTIVEDSFQELCEGQRLLITDTATLEHSGNCLAVPSELLQIWSSSQISNTFSPKNQTVLSRHVTSKDRQKLFSCGHIGQLTKIMVLDRLNSYRLPRPTSWEQLSRLWSYISSEIIRPRATYRNVHIVPVHGQDSLFSPDEVIRISQRHTLTVMDWELIEHYLLKIAPEWIQWLQSSESDLDGKSNSEINKRQIQSALDVLRAIGLHEATPIDRIFRRVILKFNSGNSDHSVKTYIQLAHIAAKLGVTPPIDFPVMTSTGEIRRVGSPGEMKRIGGEPLFVDVNDTLSKFIDPVCFKANVLHSDYMVFTDTCTESEWRQWVQSPQTNLYTFAPLVRTELHIFSRDQFQKELRKRGLRQNPKFQIKRDCFFIIDYDFDQRHWDHWHALAIDDEQFWVKLLEQLFAQSESHWANSLSATAHQDGYKYVYSVTQDPLLPNWIIRLQKLPCLRDTWGRVRMPSELLRRTPETEPLLDVEAFVSKELDTEKTQRLLDVLGVQNNTTGPRPVLRRLQALAGINPPPVFEVQKWCHALDQLFDHCSVNEMREIDEAFSHETLILTDQLQWATKEEVCLNSDDNAVPGFAFIHSDLRMLSFWNKIGVRERPSIAHELAWLKGLTSGVVLTAAQVRRFKRLVSICPNRIWDECSHWLNLKNEWTSIDHLSFSLTKQSLIQYDHLFSEVKSRIADLRVLSAEAMQNYRFAHLRHLESVIEERFQGQSEQHDSRVKEWLIALGNGLQRIVLDDDEIKERIDLNALRLARTCWNVVEDLAVVPYLDGTVAGKPRFVDVLWHGDSLFASCDSAAKLAKMISTEIGRAFGLREITDAVLLCYERTPEFINEYLEANFDLVALSDVEFGQPSNFTDASDSQSITDAQPSVAESHVSTADTDALERSEVDIPKANHVFGNSKPPDNRFADHLDDKLTFAPSSVHDSPVSFSLGGPKTSQSARADTVKSSKIGRDEPRQLKVVELSVPGFEGRELEKKFRDMVKDGYQGRCQICGKTFITPTGRRLVNIGHLVLPRLDHRTNHFGNLLGLCGWHFNMLRFGAWVYADDTFQPLDEIDGTRGWRTFILNRISEIESLEDEFVELPILVWNVYQQWLTGPESVKEKIRYTIPHWKYLCELLKA